MALRVESRFEKGSFHIHFLLDQSLLEGARETLAFATILDPHAIVHAIFGAAKEHADKVVTGAMLGLVGIWRLLKGDKPKPGCSTVEDNHGIIQIGETQVFADPKAVQMYLNDALRADVDQVARAVAKDGINKLEARKDGQVLDSISKRDLPLRIIRIEEGEQAVEHVLTDTREALLRVVTANFEKGKWKFSDGASRFSARIADPVFQRKLDAHEEGFYKGDTLRVLLTSEQKEKADGKLQTQYTIEEVLEHRRSGEQQRLLPPGSNRAK